MRRCSRFHLSLVPTLVSIAAGGCGPTSLEDANPIMETSPIINGSTTGFPESVTTRTVYVTTAGGGFCSGVVVAPRAVLTARHCTTTDGQIFGPDGAFNSMSITKNGVSRAVASGARHSTLDAALLFFADPLTPLVTWDYTYFPAPHAAIYHYLPPSDAGGSKVHYTADGYGRNTCTGGSGTERWGTVQIDAFPDNDHIRTGTHTTNQVGWKGDSGSGLWDALGGRSTITAGVQSTGACQYDSTTGSYAGSQANYVATASIYTWVRQSLYDYMQSIGLNNQSWSTGATIGVGNAWMAASSCSNTWYTSGVEMREDTNCGTSGRGNLWVFNDVSISYGYGFVQVTSTDNDDQGMAFRIQDRDNYYYVAANSQNSTLGIYKMVNGVRYTLWEQSLAIDFSTWKWIGFYVTSNLFQVYWDGTWYGPGYDNQTGGPIIQYGGVALWEDYQQNAHFRYAQVQHKR